MKKLLLLLAVTGLFSCQQKDVQVKRISNPRYATVIDTMYSQMPGCIFYQDGLIYWHDALAPENFIHIVDGISGKEVETLGSIGTGPEEYTAPMLALSPAGGLYISDANKPLERLYRWDKETDSVQVLRSDYQSQSEATRILHLQDEACLRFFPGSKRPFVTVKAGKIYRNGVLPLEEEITNGYDVFQGNIACNSQNGKLVYSAMRIPYLAVYEWGNEGWSLEKELKGTFEYTVTDKELKLSQSTRGAMELALTQDYIVLLQRDEPVEGKPEPPKYPRDMSSLPRSLFVYDYQLSLKKIINMPFPVLRICGDEATNQVYAVAVNPDFSVIKIEII